MKICILILIGFYVGTGSMAQVKKNDSKFNIIPQPVSITEHAGVFQLSSTLKIVVPAMNKEVLPVAQLLSKGMAHPEGRGPAVTASGATAAGSIVLMLNKTRNAVTGDEGYQLQIHPSRIEIRANKPAGLFYGVQTLLQLIPSGTNQSIPCLSIIDFPRFAWRGLMLDVSRHFFSKEFIKEYIDQMTRYKFNVFHWHLTDNHGWRIEIKGLPELTGIGAWRVPRTGRRGSFLGPQPGEKATDGGFYTQDDIREVVAYAQQRHVTVLPEIDVPAHSLAMIASYKNLSCTKVQYHVNPLKRNAEREDDVLCVANDSTWLILDKVFTQVAELFPGEYIHTGGDEAHKSFWENCPHDQALMKREGIQTLDELQSYFEKKLEKIIKAKGKKMIGWDEIVDGGLAPDATVMSWRRNGGREAAIKAAAQGHHIIMTPQYSVYLDLYQGDPIVEPFTYGKVRLKTCYEFEPVPEGVNAQFILGGQGNLWTEAVPNKRHAQYMTWPRSLALAETFWSQKESKNWNDFVRRMENEFRYMDRAKIKYARSAFDAIISAVKGPDDSLQVKLETEIDGLDVYYTFDGTNPDKFYPKYQGRPLDIPTGASEIRVITYRGGKPVGKQINFMLTGLKNRLVK